MLFHNSAWFDIQVLEEIQWNMLWQNFQGWFLCKSHHKVYFVESFGLLGTLMSKNIIWNVLQEDVIRFCVIYEVHKDCVTPNPTYIHRYWRSCKYLCSIFSFPCPYFFCNLPQMFVDKLVFHQTRIASNTWYFMYLILVYLEICYPVNIINLYLDTWFW